MNHASIMMIVGVATLVAAPALAQDTMMLDAQDAPDEGAVAAPRVIAFEADVMHIRPADVSTKAIDDDGVFVGSSVGLAWAPLERLPWLRGVFMYQGVGSDPQAYLDPSRSTFGGDATFEWSRQRFMVGADAGVELLNFLRPSARVAAGYSLQTLEVGPDPISDYTHDIALQASAGLEAFLDLGLLDSGEDFLSRLRIGMRYQWGWTWQSEATFDELRDRRDEADTTWRPDDVNLGSLDTDGMFWTLGINFSYAL